MPDEDCNILLCNNITGNYIKCENDVKRKIDKETKKIAESLDHVKKMECYASHPAFITIKDLKPNFSNNTKCRLINSKKNKLGLVSKKHLEEIIANVANIMKVNQWRNATTVIDLFKLLPQKDKSRFIKFDIVEFCPSISEELLNRFARSFARSITTISESVINIIHHSRKSLFLKRTSVMVKKGNNSLFDVTMGFYDGAEICELVGLVAESIKYCYRQK